MSALSQIEAAHARHRAGLLAAESAEQRRLVASYAKAIREVEGRLAKLAVEIASATENLDPIDAAEALRGKRVAQARLEGVLADMRYEVAKWTDSITPEIEALHADAVRRGVEAAESLTRIGLGTPPPGSEAMIGRAFASVDHGAVEQAVAFSHGGPVRELLVGLAGEAAEEVAQEMTSAIARGQNPLVTASRVRSKLAAPLYRAQTITRTETLRAYREATREAYQQSNLVSSWVWIAACDSRTCGACWALHGKEFPTGEKMGTHPRCRCTMAPNTRSWEELTGLRQPGVQETNLAANITSGPELFDALPDSQKLAILGPSKFAAYKDGAIKLEDLVHVEDNAIWGTTRREASLRSILGDDAANYYPRPGRAVATSAPTPPRATTTGSWSPTTRPPDPAVLADRRLGDIVGSVFGAPQAVKDAVRGMADRLHSALRIDRVGVPNKFETTFGLGDGVGGSYNPQRDLLRIGAGAHDPEEAAAFSVAHEYGHYLDWQIGGYLDFWDTVGGSRLTEIAVRSEARRSALLPDSRKALVKALQETTTGQAIRDFQSQIPSLYSAVNRNIVTEHVAYLLRDREFIARAVEQYFGMRHDPALWRRYALDRIDADGALPSYINEAEWREIEPLVEAWLREIGAID